MTTANNVFLDTVQRGPEIFGSISITSWIKEHGGTYRGFSEVFPAISRRASGQSELFGIAQNALLKELHFVHDVRDSSEDFERSLDNGVGMEPRMLIEIRWKVPSETTMPLVHTKRNRPQ